MGQVEVGKVSNLWIQVLDCTNRPPGSALDSLGYQGQKYRLLQRLGGEE
jgi:hypothetical protein